MRTLAFIVLTLFGAAVVGCESSARVETDRSDQALEAGYRSAPDRDDAYRGQSISDGEQDEAHIRQQIY